MYFPRFWTRAQSGPFEAFGWSDESLEAAKRNALERAQKIAAVVSAGAPKREYQYDRSPLREEVLGVESSLNSSTAVISRNSYGVAVLNTSNIMFVDIDSPQGRGSPNGLMPSLRSLFGFGRKESHAAGETRSLLAQAEHWFKLNPSWGCRLYETAGGFRLLITHAELNADDSKMESILSAFESDPLYIRLCKSQRSFRARLQPKPWRCGFRLPAVRWPFRDSKQQSVFKEWDTAYQKKAANFATCRFLRHIGNSAICPAAQIVIEVHDRWTKASSLLPLA